MNFSYVAKKLMAEKSIKTSELARDTGYSQQYISDLLNGQRRWNETTMDKVSKVLGIKILYLAENQLDLVVNQ